MKQVGSMAQQLQRYRPTVCSAHHVGNHILNRHNRGPRTAVAHLPSTIAPKTRCQRLRQRLCSVEVDRQAAAATAPASVSQTEQALEEVSTVSYEGGVKVSVGKRGNGTYVLDISTPWGSRDVLLHWAINDWQKAPEEFWPPGTNSADDKAVQSPFLEGRLQLAFPGDACPQQVVFVLKALNPEEWINNGGVNYAVTLKPPQVGDLIDKVISAESTYTHWSLFNRLIMANDILDAADAAGPAGMAFVFTWLRLSSNKLLAWHKGSFYQSKDIAHVQKTIAQRIADKARDSADPRCRQFARMALAGLPRGGGDGDAIRHGILNIMRENGIREGHRPGIEDKFLEQWHQKLHTNTTPDDITICEAYISFLESGSMDNFWRVCWDNGKLTPDMLANMDNPLSATPLHLPQLIGPMKHYLWILKTTHSGANVDTALEMSKGELSGELQGALYNILGNRNEWWVPGAIVEARQKLEAVWRRPCSRDVLLLDIALESYFRTCIERTDKAALKGDDLVALVKLVLQNSVIAAESEDLSQCLALWDKVAGQERWSKDWALKALAAAQRTELSLSAHMDDIYSLVQPYAERFGSECGIAESFILNFGEEVVRGQPAFVLSLLLRQLEPMLRSSAEVAPWQVVSQAAAAGEVLVLDSLSAIQGQSFDSPRVVIAQNVGGNEDIPESVKAVLTASPTDVLSHVAIRARSQGALLATCFDDAEFQALKELDGSYVAAKVDATGAVAVTKAEAPAAATLISTQKGKPAASALNIPKPKTTSAWALAEGDFAPGLVGGKSNNLAALRGKLPAGIELPASVALPFGTFERVLAGSPNEGAAAEVKMLLKELEGAKSGAGVPPALAQLRRVVAEDLQPPEGLVAELGEVASAAGLTTAGEWTAGAPAWQATWSAICRVWASKWNDRAWLSRRARGVPESALYMACLLQQVVPAEYAFVLHTAHPVTGARGEIFGELVAGMGEALVGNYPGRALAFTVPASGGEVTGDPSVLSNYSKRVGLFAADGSLIARSDSNGEDLEDFAGAGLYDSIPIKALQERTLDASQDPLLWDPAFRTQLLTEVAKAGCGIEGAFSGAPQDIEGVWAGGKLTIVQSRPQVV